MYIGRWPDINNIRGSSEKVRAILANINEHAKTATEEGQLVNIRHQILTTRTHVKTKFAYNEQQ